MMNDPFTRFRDRGPFAELVLAFGSSAPAPVIQQAPAPPTVTDPVAAQAAKDAADARAQSAGRYSTILTSGLGDQTAPVIGKKQLLGQ